MSQYKFEVKPRVECLLGWDQQLHSLFAQVYKVDEEGERLQELEEVDGQEKDVAILLWIGASKDEITHVFNLQAQLIVAGEEVKIPHEIYGKLIGEIEDVSDFVLAR